MRYSLGFDGSGIKTECVVLGASGALRAKVSQLKISPAVGAVRIASRLAEYPAPASTHGA